MHYLDFKIELVALIISSAAIKAQYLPRVTPDTRSLDQIYAAAQNETGPLQVFFGGDGRSSIPSSSSNISLANVTAKCPAGSQGDGVRSLWKARFPNVALNLTVDLSKYHDGRIDRGFYENEHVADIAVLQTLQDFPRWKAENKLQYYKPNNYDDLLENEKDLDGAYLPIQISAPSPFSYPMKPQQY